MISTVIHMDEVIFNRGYDKGRADEREKYICYSDCEYSGDCSMCVRWDKLADCYTSRKEEMQHE